MTPSPGVAVPTAPERRRTPLHVALDVVRGALIGTAETVPGVSGGTVALMTGVYETLLTSAGHIIAGVRAAVAGTLRGRGARGAGLEFAQARWAVIVPLLAGMAVALVTMARVMEELVTGHPEIMRALFLGLVLASLAVPWRHSRESARSGRGGAWDAREWLVAALAALAVAAIVSVPGARLEPTPWVIVPAAALAVSALVLPGLSGSFLLLTFGLYEPTLSALNDRDYGYLALFAGGAVVGLVTIVKLLQWLLEHHRRVTLVILTGVMAGSLVALWPWQDADGAKVAPTGDVAGPVVAFVAGAVAVAVVLVAERRVIAARARLAPRA